MQDRSKVIYGNEIDRRAYRKALHSKKKFIRKYGDDSKADYKAVVRKNQYLYDCLDLYDIRVGDAENAGNAEKTGNTKDTGGVRTVAVTGKTRAAGNDEEYEFDRKKGIIVGNIRMGFGHYRISMAIASAAHSMGYTPYWMDLNSYGNTVCTKVISAQNDLYSLGSRISQKSRLFNALVWEPMNYEGFRKLTYNSSDQKNAELMAPVYKNVPKDIPVIATHVWPAQAAVHAGMKYVVNAIPDNWPMALHLAQGSVHTVQTHYAYQGYRILNGMDGNKVLNPMSEDSLIYAGHYIDHELTSNITTDCEARRRRRSEGKPMIFLLTIGGAGAQKEIFAGIIRVLIPEIKKKNAALYVNVGDYKNVWDSLVREIPEMKQLSKEHFNRWDDTRKFAEQALTGDVEGIHGFWHENIFEAVYCTNLLMRSCDVLVTKPSELAFYPVPKLFIKRVGGHEQWGAIHSAQIGDGTLECRDLPHTIQMLRLFLKEDRYLLDMCDNIETANKMGIYNGAYKAVETAFALKDADR